MPSYNYRCSECNTEVEMYQGMSEPHECVACSCGHMAYRVWSVPAAITDNHDAYFNHGLGCMVRSKADVREAIKRINEKTGQSLVEVGTDKWRPKGPKRIEYPTAGELGIT